MKKPAKILVIDDEEDILLTLRFFLQQHFEEVLVENNPNLIPRLLRKHQFNVVILDMNFRRGDTSGREGLRWLNKVLELSPGTSVIMMTAYGDINMAVEAVKIGATDFVVKPWRNQKLMATVLSALELNKSRQTVEDLQNKQQVLSADIDQQYGEIIGQSAAMQVVFKTIEKVGKTDANVLILGENGTGKELVARALHRHSQRAKQVFINVDLGAIPDSLFESELFGHKKGAFTDAREDRVGRFEVASGGTLLLDEIGNLSLPLQAKLLSALQSRQITKVGSNQVVDVNIRLVCATNMPLNDMVKNNTFRQDLLYRINTVELVLPPLRERIEDISLLTNHFLNVYAKKYQKESLQIADETINKLEAYRWPGNIRELQHAVERAVIMSEGKTLKPADFLLQANTSKEEEEHLESYNLDDMEKWTIQKVLTKNKGNISKAAKELGITRPALYRRMEKYDL